MGSSSQFLFPRDMGPYSLNIFVPLEFPSTSVTAIPIKQKKFCLLLRFRTIHKLSYLLELHLCLVKDSN
jgi:hypothetical protein